MRGYTQLTASLLKSQLREPVGFFFLIIFSPALLLILGMIFGNDPAPEFGGRGFIDNIVPGLVTMSILIVGTSIVPSTQVHLRTSGALTRLRMTPLRASTFFAADITVSFIAALIGPLLTILTAVVVFGVGLPRNPLGLLAALMLGLVAMLALGYALGSLLPSVGAATGLGNMLMIVLMLTSGAFVPVALLDDTIQRIFHLSPSFHLADLVSRSWTGEPWAFTPVAVLLGMALTLGAAALLVSRRRW
ncbi:ABC transporter permease [Corynebacterium sp.]|uniref:ABC transporter permease n=1 Tax=Corynebacterium sp. TaxID=1720 RepID=UPI0026E03573|nr:ABC transporter permease [Corynebacterium sp.]MDO5511721.1 ABC transporter permease [Corynebacterium sp.]